MRNSAAKVSALDILKDPATVHLPENACQAVPGREIKTVAQVEQDEQRILKGTFGMPEDMKIARLERILAANLENLPEKTLELGL